MSIDYFALAWKISFPGKPLKKLVLLSLADHYNNAIGYAWPSYETIAVRCGVDRRTVIRVVAELEEDGFITREKRHRVGRMRTSNAYRLNEKLMRSAAGLSETSQVGNPHPPQAVTTVHPNGDTRSPSTVSDNNVSGDTGSPSTFSDERDGDSDTGSPLMVTDDHHHGDTGSPSIVTDDHHDGDTRSPELLDDPLSEPLEEPLSTTAAEAAEGAADAAVVADGKFVAAEGENVAAADKSETAVTSTTPEPDVVAAILRWMEFGDALKAKERDALDSTTLLAWAYEVQLERAKNGTKINNPVGLVRAKWRRGQRPRDDLHALATGWLALDEKKRGRLLGRLDWARTRGLGDDGDLLDDEFRELPLSTALAVYEVTDGALGPPALMPAAERIVKPAVRRGEEAEAREAKEAIGRRAKEKSLVWREALQDLGLQMTRATFATWLEGTTAIENGDELTVRVRNVFAVDWLDNRLRPVIERTVNERAGRPMKVHFMVDGQDAGASPALQGESYAA